MRVLPGQPGFVAPPPGERRFEDRRAVRLLVLDPQDRLLLFLDSDLGLDPVAHWWYTPGGGVEPGESDAEAAVRELWEETGHRVAPSDLVGPIAHRHVVHGYCDRIARQDEAFYAVRVPGGDITPGGLTPDEQLTLADTRWWTLDEIAETTAEVWPVDLVALRALLDTPGRWPVDLGTCEESSLAADAR